MKNNDRKIIESLITKYGKSNVNLAVNRLNENNENPKSGIFIESHDHLNCDAFRILVLDNGVNVLKNDPLEIECEGQYSAKQYIEKLEPKYGNDYIEVNYVGNLWEKSLCLINVVKALNMKYPELPIYCFTMGWNTWKGEYENVQKFFNDIFSKYLRGISFEFIPGTMGEFLKNNNMNESSKTNIVNEMVYKYDYNRLSDCPLTYNTQLDFKKYFIKRSTQEGYEFNKNIFYFDDIDCVDTKTLRDIPGVKANKTLNFDEAYNRLLKYFLNNLQEHVNESNNPSMYDAFGEVIYPGDYVIVVAHNDKYPEGKMLKGTFVKLAANSRLVGVIEIEEYDQKTYKFPKYIKEPQICIAKYK